MFKLFKNHKSKIERHVAGATIVHKSPFRKLKSPIRIDEVSYQFLKQWNIGFYMDYFILTDENDEELFQLISNLDRETVKQQLGYFDWRCRLNGAYLTSIMMLIEFEEAIGIQFLKSEVCYAGEGYTFALASFNTQKSKDYLIQYLNYYLTQPHLGFEQGIALAALIWLDNKNDTSLVEQNELMTKWNEYISNKSYANLDKNIDYFNQRMNKIEKLKQQIETDI